MGMGEGFCHGCAKQTYFCCHETINHPDGSKTVEKRCYTCCTNMIDTVINTSTPDVHSAPVTLRSNQIVPAPKPRSVECPCGINRSVCTYHKDVA